MQFEEALKSLKEGQPIRRASQKDWKWMRLVEPKIDPGVDGPTEIFVVSLDGRLATQFDPFDTEKEAKAGLALAKKELAAAWKQYHADDLAWKEASAKERESKKLSPGIDPGLPRSYYDAAEVLSRPPVMSQRMSAPYLIVMTSEGVVTPRSLDGSDLLATDWQVA